jgi:iron complex transport system substrate-binding protein
MGAFHMKTFTRRGMLAASGVIITSRAFGTTSERIICLGGSITEVVYRLGHDRNVVGVDATSQFPPQALKDKRNVGYVRALGPEGMLSLTPTLVLASDSAGPPATLQLVEQAGVRIVRISDEPSPTGILRLVGSVAAALDASETGRALSDEIDLAFSSLAAERAKIGQPARVLFVLSLQNGRPLVGGHGTTADAILTLAGAANAVPSLEGWKPLSDEGIVAAAPEVIVTLDRGPGHAAADPFDIPSFAATPAAKERRVVTMDALYALGFGPRTPAAARDLMAAVYREQLH